MCCLVSHEQRPLVQVGLGGAFVGGKSMVEMMNELRLEERNVASSSSYEITPTKYPTIAAQLVLSSKPLRVLRHVPESRAKL